MAPERDEAELLRRWHQNLANGSEVYADVSARRLRAFCVDMKTSATQLIAAELPDLRALTEDYLAKEKKRGHSGEYIRTTLKAIRSWRLYNGTAAVEGLKVPNATLSPKVDSEEMTTQADLRRLLLAAKPHERVAIALMAFSGCRPQVIGNYGGTDGVRLGDLVDLELDGPRVTFANVPALIRVRSSNSKAKHGYQTFLGEEGCAIVVQYLEQRRIAGEKLTAATDLVHPEKANKAFVRALNIGDGVRRAMRATGLPQRPYVWRAYFLSRMLEAANAGKVSDRYVEYWAGHRGDVTAKHYTTGRANLASSMIEDMRAAYKRCEPFLTTLPASDDDSGASRVIKAFLVAKGMPQDKADKLDLSAMSNPELNEMFKTLGASASAPVVRAERAVAISDVPRLLEGGWEFVSRLDERQAILRSPSLGPAVGWTQPVSAI